MEKTLLNQTWSIVSDTTLENVNSTLTDVIPTKDPQITTLDWETAKTVINIIDIILQFMFLVVGLFGNVFTIAVLFSKKWTNKTSKYILIALAVSDTTMIICHTLNQDFLKKLFKFDIRALSNIGCIVFFVFYRTSKLSSSWFVAFLCFERFVAVKFPHKIKILITKLRTKVYIIVTYLTMATFASIMSFSNTITKSKTCKKDAFTPNLKPVFQALLLAEMLLYSVLPIILMTVLTPVIILQLFKRYKARKTLSSETETGKLREMQQLKEMVRTTVILISVVTAFIICVTPMTVFQQVKFWLLIKKENIETTKSLFVFRTISQRLKQVNYSINFFLYIYTSSTFRKTMLEMLHIKKCKERQY